MQAFWGRYPFPVNQAATTSSIRVITGDNLRPLRRVVTISVDATLDGTGQAALTAAEDACKLALAQSYQDFILKQDSGAASGTRLINQESLSGVRVVSGPDFYDASNGEYVNQRKVRFTAEAVYVYPGSESAIVSWTETLSVQGDGGPDHVWRFPINKFDPFPQEVSRRSLIVTTQSGSAVGHVRYPDFPPPRFGKRPRNAVFVGKAAVNNTGTPKALGQGWIEWPINWSYQWNSIVVLAGTPYLPPLF